MSATILVTGATGNVGAQVVKALPESVSVRAAVRNPTRAQSQLPAHVQAVRLDFEDPGTFAPALDGVQGVFLVRPPQLADIRIFEPFIAAAQDAQVQQMVFLSLQGIERVSFVPHAKIEALIVDSGIPYTFLRAGFFMQNLDTVHRDEIAEDGEIYLPAGKSKTAFIDVRDIGAVGAHVLTHAGHTNQVYTLTGAEALDYHEVAQVFSEELGREIRYSSPSVPRFAWRFWRRGNSPGMALVTSFLYTMTRFGQAQAVHPDVQQLLGRAPISLRQYVRDYRSAWT